MLEPRHTAARHSCIQTPPEEAFCHGGKTGACSRGAAYKSRPTLVSGGRRLKTHTITSSREYMKLPTAQCKEKYSVD
jgi:hypothetical protein